MIDPSPVCQAAREAIARWRHEHAPYGLWSDDGRWVPAPDEMRECCLRIYRYLPSRPVALYRHCHTVKHLAKLYGVKPRDLKREIARQMGGKRWTEWLNSLRSR